MKITSAYKTKILLYNDIFSDTLTVYQQAVSFFVGVIYQHHEPILALKGKKQNSLIERFCVKTKKNPSPSCDFSQTFYKFPSYYRRAAIQFALGHVKSYLSNLENWQKSGQQKGKPTLQLAHKTFPVLYHAQSVKRPDAHTAKIKIYHQNDWIWLDVNLKPRDVSYIKKHCTDKTAKAPTLIKKGKCWYLSTPYEKQVTLPEKNIAAKIVAVDLGINHSAVCIIPSNKLTCV